MSQYVTSVPKTLLWNKCKHQTGGHAKQSWSARVQPQMLSAGLHWIPVIYAGKYWKNNKDFWDIEFCSAVIQKIVGNFTDVLRRDCASCYGYVSWIIKLNEPDWRAFSNETSVIFGKNRCVKDRIWSDGPSWFKQRKEKRPKRMRQNLIRVDH